MWGMATNSRAAYMVKHAAGNPWTDADIDNRGVVDFMWNHAVISDKAAGDCVTSPGAWSKAKVQACFGNALREMLGHLPWQTVGAIVSLKCCPELTLLLRRCTAGQLQFLTHRPTPARAGSQWCTHQHGQRQGELARTSAVLCNQVLSMPLHKCISGEAISNQPVCIVAEVS